MTKVMILGAGVYQLPLIMKAQEMGLTTVVVSPVGRYPGIALADVWIDCDVRDKDKILEVARAERIDAILTTGSDVSVPAIGHVVDALGLAGTGYAASILCADKHVMKKAFADHGIRTARFEVASTLAEVVSAAESIGFPVMIKAVDSSGSRGITRVEAEAELLSAYEAAQSVSQSKLVVVEEYLVGQEFGAQAVVVGDQVLDILCHADVVTPPPVCVPIGHSMPIALSDATLTEVKELIASAISALKIRDTIANVDVMLVNGVPYLLEIGARMGGTCLPENISIYMGVNAYELLLRIALGEAPSLDFNYPKTPSASLLVTSDASGVVSWIDAPKVSCEGITWSMDVGPGDKVTRFKVGSDRIGQVIASACSLKEAENLAASFTAKIRVEVADE